VLASGPSRSRFLLVRIDGLVRLGLPVVLLAGLAGCTSTDDPASVERPDVAVMAYKAPAGAPGFCSRLATLTELGGLPASIGMLVAGTDVEARTQVAGVVRELRGVLSTVRSEGGQQDLVTALDGLVQALGQVGEGPLPDPVRSGVTAGLDQVAAEVQPLCGFPT
jgi:hypothetical protein